MGFIANLSFANDLIAEKGLTDKDFVGIYVESDAVRLHLQWNVFCRLFGGQKAEVKASDVETVMGFYTHYVIQQKGVVWIGLRPGQHEGTVVPA